MRYVAMQVFTWGTVAGAVVCALLLTTMESPELRYRVQPGADLPQLLKPGQLARAREDAAVRAQAPSPAASSGGPSPH